MVKRHPITEVLEILGADREILQQLRGEGLFEDDYVAPDAADELRVAASLMRDLDVNPAGVDVVLQMRRRLLALEDLTSRSLRRLLAELEGR